MAAVVVKGRSYIPIVNSVRGHVGALGRCDVGNDAGSWRGKGCAEEVKGVVEAGVGGKLGKMV